MSNTHFKIIIPAYNSEEWISHSLTSVLNQDYDNFECLVTDDYSTDGTSKIIDDFIKEYDDDACRTFTAYQNAERKYALYNIHAMIQDMAEFPHYAEDEDVIVCLDGDDWLNGVDVLTTLDEVYSKEDCWLTYGSYVIYPGGQDSSFHVSEYSEGILKNGNFKNDPQWRASHLRSFKYKIAKQLVKEDLTDENGDYYQMAWDHAIMFPLMEMACERVKFVEDIFYVYNDANPLNVHKVDRQGQIDTAEKIRLGHSKKERIQ